MRARAKSLIDWFACKKRVNGQYLKRLIIAAGLKEDRCDLCGQGPIWNEQPLVIQLDHIDGDDANNVFENLRFACPNCHTQTKTFGRRNKRKH